MMLTESAQRIARGNYNDPIPMSHHHDELGRLQDNFQQMQQSLASHIGELEQLTATLQERGDELRKAYDQAQKADRMKTAFLHNMTNQMVGPAGAINKDVAALSASGHEADAQEMNRLTDDIQQNGNAITCLLNDLLHLSDEEEKKKGGPV
jgi:nitrate/nitrite-specific signal transduction histidine kinase